MTVAQRRLAVLACMLVPLLAGCLEPEAPIEAPADPERSASQAEHNQTREPRHILGVEYGNVTILDWSPMNWTALTIETGPCHAVLWTNEGPFNVTDGRVAPSNDTVKRGQRLNVWGPVEACPIQMSWAQTGELLAEAVVHQRRAPVAHIQKIVGVHEGRDELWLLGLILHPLPDNDPIDPLHMRLQLGPTWTTNVTAKMVSYIEGEGPMFDDRDVIKIKLDVTDLHIGQGERHFAVVLHPDHEHAFAAYRTLDPWPSGPEITLYEAPN